MESSCQPCDARSPDLCAVLPPTGFQTHAGFCGNPEAGAKCARLCVFYVGGGCTNGDGCKFCHWHTEKLNMNSRQRRREREARGAGASPVPAPAPSEVLGGVNAGLPEEVLMLPPGMTLPPAGDMIPSPKWSRGFCGNVSPTGKCPYHCRYHWHGSCVKGFECGFCHYHRHKKSLNAHRRGKAKTKREMESSLQAEDPAYVVTCICHSASTATGSRHCKCCAANESPVYITTKHEDAHMATGLHGQLSLTTSSPS